MIRKSISFIIIVLGAAFALRGGQEAISPPSTARNRQTTAVSTTQEAAIGQLTKGQATDRQDYVISPDDELSVNILDVPEISGNFRVSPAGTLILPLVSQPIPAAGLTLTQLSDVISLRLRQSGMISHPHVNVQVRESHAHAIAVVGAVKKPLVYSVFGKTTLLDALSQAGGLADDAGPTAIITRGDIAARVLGLAQQGNSSAQKGSRTVKVDLAGLLQNGDSSLNIDIYPGDSITVERAGIVYVIGAVKRAGGFVLKDREQMTVLKALALAEYMSTTAVPQKAVIIRKAPQDPGGTTEVPVDIKKILNRRAPDKPLMASDILYIPDSTGKRVLHRAGDAAAEAAALFVYRVP